MAELAKCGVSYGYIKSAVCRQRKETEVYCWPHHKEGKTVYLHYHGLKQGYQELIKTIHCDGAEPEVYLKTIETDKVQAQIDDLSDQITSLVHTDPDELKHLMATQLFTPTEAHQLARAAGWLRLINEFDVKRARKLGFESIETLRAEIFKRCLNEQTNSLIRFKKGTITSARVLYRNAAIYKNEGIKSLIHAGAGNVNRQKADKFSHAVLIEMASKPVKYSFEDIGLMYNDWAEVHGKPCLTVEAIKKYLNDPPIKRIWFYARHGKLAADNVMQPLMNRDKPSFPDAMWSLDGTAIQMYFRDENDKIQSDLYCYFVSDVNTGAILGYSIAYAETAALVEVAMRYAVNTYGYRPYQLQYDNSSANKAFVTDKLMTNMSRVHFPCEPYKGRGKYVEGVIGHFQQRVLRKRENFKGGNISSVSLNSKANPELLAKFTKNPMLLMTMDEVVEEFSVAVTEWNSRGEERDSFGRFVGQSKIERYLTIEHEKRVKLNYFDKISLFFIEQKQQFTYGANGIELEVNKHKYHFIVPDPDSVGDFIFANEHLGQKFTVRMDREHPDMIVLYQDKKIVAQAYEKERYAAAVADYKDGEKSKQVLFKKKQDEFGQKLATRELERQLNILDELKSTGTDGLGWWDTDKHIQNKRESVVEDVANGIKENLSDIQKKILKIGR